MEFIEKVFQKLWSDKRMAEKKKSTTVFLNQLKPYVHVVSSFILGPNEIKDVISSKSHVGFVDDHLYLPEWIGWSEDSRINKNSYLYLTLLACATKKLKLYAKLETNSHVAKRMEFFNRYSDVNNFLDSMFFSFEEFQSTYLSAVAQFAASEKKNSILPMWETACQRNNMESNKFSTHFLESLKSNDEIPHFLYISSVNCFTQSTLVGVDQFSHDLSLSKKNMTEQKKINSTPVSKVDLEKEKKSFNPVSHSFEKLETADDYKGGYRLDSGDDQLNDHMDALDELEMSSLTSQGEAAQSVYSSDIQHFLSSKKKEEAEETRSQYIYPEWFSKSRSYESDHCSLFETHIVSTGASTIKKRVDRAYQAEISQYRSDLERIVNQPTWNKRQLDGVELDLDECVRFQSDVISKNLTHTPRLYTTKKKSLLDVNICILFDQSLSTDSWVDNMRVFDVIRDALVMMGILFDDIISNVQIAGTWSVTRKNCMFNLVKDNNESWDSFYSKIEMAEPQGYTRLGPAIRHVRSRMKKQSSEKKILIILTDGKPSDIDSYEGVHGIQDIKKACLELDSDGIVPIAVLIDKEDKGHFHTMFNMHFVLNSPKQLPNQLFHILSSVLK